MLAIDKFGKRECVVSILLMAILGLVSNNNGYIGLLVIAANIIYTGGTFICRKELTIKINIMVDLILWIVYELLIIDISSLIADTIGLVVAAASLVRYFREKGNRVHSSN